MESNNVDAFTDEDYVYKKPIPARIRERGSNLVVDEGEIKCKFTIYYGNECLGTMKFPTTVTMENVRNEIVKYYTLSNTSPGDFTTEGIALDYTKKIQELSSDEIGLNIEIKRGKETIISEVPLFKKITGLIKTDKLVEFNPRYVLYTLEIEKSKWYTLESNLIKNSSKLNNRFDSIQKGETRDLAFSLFVIYYARNYFEQKNLAEIEEDLKPLIRFLKSQYDWTEEFQKVFESYSGF